MVENISASKNTQSIATIVIFASQYKLINENMLTMSAVRGQK